MMLIIGPTCVGKSTFIKELQLGSHSLKTQFGYEVLTEGVSDCALLHYNMLHYWTTRDLPDSASDFLSDPIFNKIMDKCATLKEVIILVSPVAELVSRASSRKKIEDGIATEYDNNFWINAIINTNLYLLYTLLHSFLVGKGIIARYVYSSSSNGITFRETDYVYIHHNLNGVYIQPPSVESVKKIKNLPGFNYQEILLPHGFITEKGSYNHLHQSRSKTFNLFIDEILDSESLLDVGSAVGELTFFAERLGCKSVDGIEIDRARFNASLSAKEILSSNVKFHNIDFHSFDSVRTYDCVTCLNVVHHITNIDEFFNALCAISKKYIIIEHPTLQDSKFQNLHNLNNFNFSDDLPLIGVSSRLLADQTYVFSSKAIEAIISNADHGFELIKKMDSPIPSRKVMVFKRHS